MAMNRLFTLMFALLSVAVSAQKRCGTNERIAQLSNDPEFFARHQAITRYLKDARMHQRNLSANMPNVTVTIPVVFHVLYKNNNQNISDSQIESQLAVMNADFRRLNSDFSSVVPEPFQCYGADMEICFAKATIAPNGQPTNGITRKHVDDDFNLETQYYTEEGELAWDTSHYLNVWIGRFPTFGYLGFGTPPAAAGQAYDGLCISYKCVGSMGSSIPPYNKGRTIVHELGHYLGLLHPWGEDESSCGEMTNDDGLEDTPAINDPHFGCPSYPENSNMCDPDANGAMFMNFMDYVDDACMAFFTDGQKSVAQATLAGPRSSLLGVRDIIANSDILVYPNPADKYFVIHSDKTYVDKVEIYSANGQLKKVAMLDKVENVIGLENLPQGVYFLRIYGNGKFLRSDKIIKK